MFKISIFCVTFFVDSFFHKIRTTWNIRTCLATSNLQFYSDQTWCIAPSTCRQSPSSADNRAIQIGKPPSCTGAGWRWKMIEYLYLSTFEADSIEMLITTWQECKCYHCQVWHISCAIKGLDHCKVYHWILFFQFVFVVHAVSAHDNDWKLDPPLNLFAILFPDGWIMMYYNFPLIYFRYYLFFGEKYMLPLGMYETLEHVSKKR